MQNAKTLMNFGIEQFGIQLVKPNTCFASKVKRFQGGFGGNKDEAPGPGQYGMNQGFTQTKGQVHWKANQKDSKYKQTMMQQLQNPPSIPSHNAVFGYNEDDRGKLIRSDGPDKVLSGIGKETVGPGDYDQNMKATSKGVTKWHQNTHNPILEKKKEKEIQKPGPGHYQPAIQTVNPVYKNNRSSVFASKVDRDQKNKLRVMSGNKNAKKQAGKYAEIAQAASLHKGIQDVLESDEDDETPGPGAHWNPGMSSFKP